MIALKKILSVFCVLVYLTCSLFAQETNITQRVLFNEGVEFYKAGDYKKAIEKFDLALEEKGDGDSSVVKLFKAKALEQTGNKERAKAILAEIIKDERNTRYRDEARVDIARFYFEEGGYYKAAEEFLKIIADSKSPEYVADAKGYLENIAIGYLGVDLIDSLSAKSNKDEIKAFLLLVAGKKLDSTGKTKEAKNKYFTIIEKYPNSEEHVFAVKYFTGGAGDTVKTKTESIIIGVVLPLKLGEGAGSSIAREVLEGIKFATHEHNIQSDKKVGLKIFDTNGNPEKIKILHDEIKTTPGIRAILGPLFSEESGLVCTEYEDLRIPILSPTATDDDLTKRCAYFYQLNPPFLLRGKGFAQYIYFVENKKKIVVISSTEGYSKNLAQSFIEEFTNLGGKIVKKFNYSIKEPQIDSVFEYLKKRSKDYEGIYIPLSSDNLAPHFLSGFLTNEIKANIYGNQDWLNSKGLESHSELNNRFVVSSDYFIDYQSEEFSQFNKMFNEKTNLEVNRNVLYGYDAAKYLLGILLVSNKEKSLEELLADDKLTVSGLHNSIGLDSGRANRYQNIIRFKNNVFELIDRFRTEK
ncbi:MAG: penicillin-binding protein activator [Ignavibacteriaceae bacterium]